MVSSNKYYKKALNYYEDGYIEKALKTCEASISLDLKNTAALNLKGILYYLKGDLKNAEAVWKLNSQMNNDSVAKKYLENIKSDEERQKLYINAVKLVNEVRINEAAELLKKCEQSDFNAINVKNYLCICYMKQCKYEQVKEMLGEVLQIDRKNETALSIKKQLIEYDIIKNKINIKPVIAAAAIILIAVVIILSSKYMFKHINIKKSGVSSTTSTSKIKQPVKAKNSSKSKQIENSQKSTAVVQFPAADFQNALNNKNFENIYNYVSQWSDKDLAINDKKLLSDGEKLLADEGTSYFYKSGTSFFNQKDYANAQVQLNKAYANGSSSYLYPHIIYFLATSYNNSKNFEQAVKYYEMYDQSFASGDYEETVLYNLAMIYKDTDMNKAKQYASKLSQNYPNSIYNNSNIKAMVKD